MRLFFVGAFIGCGAATPVLPVSPTPDAPPIIKPHASYSITMAELGDADIAEKISHHARMVRRGDAWLRIGGESFARDHEELGTRPVLGVVGETGDRVRVVSDDHDARIAVWIPRSDLALTTAAPIAIDDARGEIGVWLEPGVDLDVASGGDAAITLRDDDVHAVGRVRSAALGTVWIGRVPVAPPQHAPYVVGQRVIRPAPGGDARVIAEVEHPVSASRLGTRDGWTEVEVSRAGARIRGYVRATDVADNLSVPITLVSRHGHGFGMSNVDQVELPAGTCLFDRENGDVIGVNLTQVVRYGSHKRDEPWGRVFVETAWWGITEVAIHAVDGTASWELCTAH